MLRALCRSSNDDSPPGDPCRLLRNPTETPAGRIDIAGIVRRKPRVAGPPNRSGNPDRFWGRETGGGSKFSPMTRPLERAMADPDANKSSIRRGLERNAADEPTKEEIGRHATTAVCVKRQRGSGFDCGQRPSTRGCQMGCGSVTAGETAL